MTISDNDTPTPTTVAKKAITASCLKLFKLNGSAHAEVILKEKFNNSFSNDSL
jgi:hypothetical protein